ncbi:MAG: TIGR02757 family protein [Candidatus Hydrogenedentota bacterium]
MPIPTQPSRRFLLEELYDCFNQRAYVEPDPLQMVLEYEDPSDREIVGLIAASLAFGNVKQILASIGRILPALGSPAQYLAETAPRIISRRFRDFRHRYASGDDLARLLCGIQQVRAAYGALEVCFVRALRASENDVVIALGDFTDALRVDPAEPNFLLPHPSRGSACKRLHLYLRWMVRRDAVDPGGWEGVDPAVLMVPMDTHMHRLARRMGLSQRRQADARTVREVTEGFRQWAPEDPARYDFALTRLGIRREARTEEFLAAWANAAEPSARGGLLV